MQCKPIWESIIRILKDTMNFLRFVGISTTNEGDTNILLRQSTNDGQYAVEICLNMEQFSGLMALLRGLEMYLMDMELRKPDPSLLTAIAETQADTGDDNLSILNSEHIDIRKQTTKKTPRKRKSETIQEEEAMN